MGSEMCIRDSMYELLAVNIALILLDVALLSVEYEDLYEIEITLKGLVYSIKLKLELGVLSRLVRMVTHGNGLQRTTELAAAPEWLPSGDKLHEHEQGSSDLEPEHVETAATRTGSGVPWLAPLQTAHSPDSLTTLKKRQTSTAANMEFLTTPDVTRPKANDEATRTFYEELAAEMGVARKTPTYPPPPQDDEQEDMREKQERRGEEEEEAQAGAEERHVAFLAPVVPPASADLRPEEPSRQSSITNMYPGRISGGSGEDVG